MIHKEDCVDRALYEIDSRNLSHGVYRASTEGFLGLRTKFDREYVFEEYHHDNGAPYGTVTPIQRLPFDLSEGILNEERLPGSWCSVCHRKLEPYVDVETFRRRPFIHLDGASRCVGSYAYVKSNGELFNWLKETVPKAAS